MTGVKPSSRPSAAKEISSGPFLLLPFHSSSANSFPPPVGYLSIHEATQRSCQCNFSRVTSAYVWRWPPTV
ncbi:hypothetical protein EVAR_46420_1 [Eumeta japonica]|uniref:Uncharacterized protein n=1 Tax=Eumeta variegata TaxID=151549 RepID=A0A4C1XGZ4_EUMVA|nr:hypothetical protein EVAR_46420_1 [Eumeta japonica]